jgi:hypothetical protein
MEYQNGQILVNTITNEVFFYNTENFDPIDESSEDYRLPNSKEFHNAPRAVKIQALSFKIKQLEEENSTMHNICEKYRNDMSNNQLLLNRWRGDLWRLKLPEEIQILIGKIFLSTQGNTKLYRIVKAKDHEYSSRNRETTYSYKVVKLTFDNENVLNSSIEFLNNTELSEKLKVCREITEDEAKLFLNKFCTNLNKEFLL